MGKKKSCALQKNCYIISFVTLANILYFLIMAFAVGGTIMKLVYRCASWLAAELFVVIDFYGDLKYNYHLQLARKISIMILCCIKLPKNLSVKSA